MSQIKAIIADDEENLRLGLKIILEKLWPELLICQEAENGLQALEAIEKMKPDIAFLDIKMPGMSGVEVAKKVVEKTHVVFITAYDHYAVEAFESEAIDYVLKPVTKKRLEKTIERLKKHIFKEPDDAQLGSKLKKIIDVLENRDVPERLRLIKIKTGTEIRFIPVSEVLFFMAEDKYTTVKTAKKEYLIKTPIKDLENQLDPEQFWRVHRSSIVNIDKIQTIKRSFTNQMMIAFENINRAIPVSRSCEHLFKYM